MDQLYLIPHWFFGYDIVLELLFGLITLSVALYALKVYKLCSLKSCKLFGISFLLISAAYFLWAFVNIYASSLFDANTSALSLKNLSIIGTIGVYGHVLFMILGLATLAYVTLKNASYRTYTIISTLSLVCLVFSANKPVAFYFVSSFLLFFVLVFYIREYIRVGTFNSFLVALSFVFLFFGSADFTLASVYRVHYVVGHLFHFAGYALMLTSFILTLRRR